MKYVIAGIIILLVLLFDLLVSHIRENGGKNIVDSDLDVVIDTIMVVDYDCINMGAEYNHNDLELIPVIIGTGSGYGGSHSVLDKARLDDHNDYEPE